MLVTICCLCDYHFSTFRIELTKVTMGSEQSQHAAQHAPRLNQRPVSADTGRLQQLQRGYTVATSDNLNNSQLVDSSPPPPLDSRPTSPPMSVCSDSELPYVSYTDKPIGGNFFVGNLLTC